MNSAGWQCFPNFGNIAVRGDLHKNVVRLFDKSNSLPVSVGYRNQVSNRRGWSTSLQGTLEKRKLNQHIKWWPLQELGQPDVIGKLANLSEKRHRNALHIMTNAVIMTREHNVIIRTRPQEPGDREDGKRNGYNLSDKILPGLLIKSEKLKNAGVVGRFSTKKTWYSVQQTCCAE